MRDLTHGTFDTYRRHGCRCHVCKAANTRHQAEWRKKHPEKIREIKRRSYQRNAARVRAQSRAYRLKHPTQIRAYMAVWRAANPDRVRQYGQKHRSARAPLTTCWPFTRTAEHLDPLTAAINAAIPRTLPPHIREDIAQELAVDLLTNGGPVTPEAVAAAIKSYWRSYPLMAGRDLSLDAPAYTNGGDSRERWIDRIADPASLAALDDDEASA